VLIILSKSLTAKDSASIFDMAARLAEKGEGIAILHIQDACSAVASPEYCDRLLKSKINVYALKADVEARGLAERIHPNVKMVDYKQWVSLMMNKHNKIVSWTS
jgi:tRNA 2-thiouridine synthesizing protein B